MLRSCWRDGLFPVMARWNSENIFSFFAFWLKYPAGLIHCLIIWVSADIIDSGERMLLFFRFRIDFSTFGHAVFWVRIAPIQISNI